MKKVFVVLLGVVSFLIVDIYSNDVILLFKVFSSGRLVFDQDWAEYSFIKEYPFFYNRRDFDIPTTLKDSSRFKNKKIFSCKMNSHYPISGFPRKKVIAT